MEKIAFVTVRYGKEINGGAELHCRMLAERLVGRYDVEVLTTCVKNYVTGGNEFPEGTERCNGVLVRRFNADPHEEMSRQCRHKAKRVAKYRYVLYHLKLLRLLAGLFPVWSYNREYELRAFGASVFYSSGLFSFIKAHKDDYKVLIPISLDYPHLYYTALYAPEKTLIIPTMHCHKVAFRGLLTEVFTKVAYVGFNTTAEERLAERVFGPHMSPHGIVSVSFELASPANWPTTMKKFGLPDEYLLYVGRVDKSKLRHIFEFFLAYKEKYRESKLKLVLVGGLFVDCVKHPDIIYTGFVDDSEKAVIIEHAKIVVNPSKHESLSLILLEAMSLKKPMLVNGFCNVFKEHCKKSKHAAFSYYFKWDFIRSLHRLDTSVELREQMGEKGAIYVRNNYRWDLILHRLTSAIEYVSSAGQMT